MKKKLQPESPPALHTSDAKRCQITVIDLIPAVYCSSFSDSSPQEAQFVLYNCEKSGAMLVFPCHFLLAIVLVFPVKKNGQWDISGKHSNLKFGGLPTLPTQLPTLSQTFLLLLSYFISVS